MCDPRRIFAGMPVAQVLGMTIRRAARLALTSILATALAVVGAVGTADATGRSCARNVHAPAPRLLISVSRVSNQSPALGASASEAARQSIIETLARRGDVVVDAGNTPNAMRRMRRARLTGHNFEATIRSVQRRGASVRVTVSIVVSTLAGRSIQFESERTVTVTGASEDAEQIAIRHALESAVNSSVEQLLRG